MVLGPFHQLKISGCMCCVLAEKRRKRTPLELFPFEVAKKGKVRMELRNAKPSSLDLPSINPLTPNILTKEEGHTQRRPLWTTTLSTTVPTHMMQG